MCYEHHGTGRDFSAIWLYNTSTTYVVQGWMMKMLKCLLSNILCKPAVNSHGNNGDLGFVR
jgi:hypothetical protein